MSKSAKIYLPSKTATQSGVGNTKLWVLEFAKDDTDYQNFLMGWNGSRNPSKQVILKFSSLNKAASYAKKMGLEYDVLDRSTHTIKKKSYAENFK